MERVREPLRDRQLIGHRLDSAHPRVAARERQQRRAACAPVRACERERRVQGAILKEVEVVDRVLQKLADGRPQVLPCRHRPNRSPRRHDALFELREVKRPRLDRRGTSTKVSLHRRRRRCRAGARRTTAGGAHGRSCRRRWRRRERRGGWRWLGRGILSAAPGHHHRRSAAARAARLHHALTTVLIVLIVRSLGVAGGISLLALALGLGARWLNIVLVLVRVAVANRLLPLPARCLWFALLPRHSAGITRCVALHLVV
mmetsp:Transcript_75372/g.207994  ORF Transcript_75372/g.207994 Transcript_75372/m.207994 type:complete len:259 (-) Transcript_75372:325-1101(-)